MGRQMNDLPGHEWRRNVSSGSNYEARVGYSRAVRVGNQVFVAGTTAIQDGRVVGVGDPAAQTRVILSIIERALADAGASWRDVVRYRVYLVDVAHWQAVAEELAATFSDVRPVNTLVGVSWLVQPEMLVEIDMDAVLAPGR